MSKFKIKRYNPEKQAEAYFEEFDFEIPESATLLDYMNHIKWTMDGSFTFRMSCRSAICGSCAVRVNGHATLACQKQAVDLLNKDEVVLEPLGNMKPMKDLAVDFTQFWDKVNKVNPYMKSTSPPPEKERLQSPEEFKLIDDASTCIMCGACYFRL